jgi:hypothetical protein
MEGEGIAGCGRTRMTRANAQGAARHRGLEVWTAVDSDDPALPILGRAFRGVDVSTPVPNTWMLAGLRSRATTGEAS